MARRRWRVGEGACCARAGLKGNRRPRPFGRLLSGRAGPLRPRQTGAKPPRTPHAAPAPAARTPRARPPGAGGAGAGADACYNSGREAPVQRCSELQVLSFCSELF